ncbi:hypothetical protein BN6_22820 [Saccharothrix espanaensis DSM 44229]|uniref:Uncharacterized protein n=1 Tax=Saccharothrix espanaensis (strain ATCC 51144 / DSM 44229 / JCM 9112 / NBRC 15066 / NRRL 15764) TaxID=1179773 RepID=K0JVY9_SACES|nr:hypothetical protein BN6_22820 [Saccharothrix espanaensis DSM 44229]
MLPRTDKCRRYGILVGLAEADVLPTAVIAPSLDRSVPTTERHEAARRVPGGSRSDVVLPLAAWRGADGRPRSQVGAGHWNSLLAWAIALCIPTPRTVTSGAGSRPARRRGAGRPTRGAVGGAEVVGGTGKSRRSR